MLWYPELDRPRLRPVEAIPVDVHGETMVALRDPLGLAEEGVGVPVPVFFLLTQMTGSNTVEAIAKAYERHFGDSIPAEKVRQIVLHLDRARLLESEVFRQHRDGVLAAYRSSDAREMVHGGSGYAVDPETFRTTMNSHFMAKGGPGRLPRSGSGPEVRVLISPHIDFHRGGPNYGWAYQALGDGPAPETVVILGTAHAHCGQPFTATRLPFTTPLGVLPVESGFLDELQARLDFDLAEDELLHLSEHSVEFQAVALHHVFPNAPGMRFVPILCGSMHEEAEEGRATPNSRFEKAVRALVFTITAWPRRVTVIAGADLAHIGPHFGDESPVSDVLLAAVHRLDHEALARAAAGDATGFLQSFADNRNQRRVCSVACIYTALRCLPAMGVSRGRVLNYMQSVHPGGEMAVTHAAVAFP